MLEAGLHSAHWCIAWCWPFIGSGRGSGPGSMIAGMWACDPPRARGNKSRGPPPTIYELPASSVPASATTTAAQTSTPVGFGSAGPAFDPTCFERASGGVYDVAQFAPSPTMPLRTELSEMLCAEDVSGHGHAAAGGGSSTHPAYPVGSTSDTAFWPLGDPDW